MIFVWGKTYKWITFLPFRTPSDTTCPCTVALCAYRTREQEKAPGGCWTQREERMESHLDAELPPWTTAISLSRVEEEPQRKRSLLLNWTFIDISAKCFFVFLILLNLDYMYSVFLCSTISRWLYRKGLKEEQAAPVPSTLPGLEVQTPTAMKILTTGKPLGRVPALMPVLWVVAVHLSLLNRMMWASPMAT